MLYVNNLNFLVYSLVNNLFIIFFSLSSLLMVISIYIYYHYIIILNVNPIKRSSSMPVYKPQSRLNLTYFLLILYVYL